MSGLMWPECVGSFWITKTLMLLNGPHVPQIWILLRIISRALCFRASDTIKLHHKLSRNSLMPCQGHSRDPSGHHSTSHEEHAKSCWACGAIHTTYSHFELPWWNSCKLDQPVISVFLLWFSVWFWIQHTVGWQFLFPLTTVTVVLFSKNSTMFISKDFRLLSSVYCISSVHPTRNVKANNHKPSQYHVEHSIYTCIVCRLASFIITNKAS